MKAKAVSALRSKRGLHRVNGAEPPVVGLTPQTTHERRANTMQTYLLRVPKTVEPQSVRSRAGITAGNTEPDTAPSSGEQFTKVGKNFNATTRCHQLRQRFHTGSRFVRFLLEYRMINI
jgi:hypothetical protein